MTTTIAALILESIIFLKVYIIFLNSLKNFVCLKVKIKLTYFDQKF